MLIGITGKINSGKDTIGAIIQYLIDYKAGPGNYSYEDWLSKGYNKWSKYEVKKFADTLKDMVCLLIYCTREQLEDQEFKNTPLGPEWRIKELFSIKRMITLDPDNDYPHIPFKDMTPRLLLQLLGTQCGREILHPNVWVNALFSKYNLQLKLHGAGIVENSEHYPNWIITDMRFPNEMEAIVDRKGITIRVVRNMWYSVNEEGHHVWSDSENLFTGDVFTFSKEFYTKHQSWVHFLNRLGLDKDHESETALDTYRTDYTIYNNGSIEELIETVKEILTKEEVI